MIKGFSNNKGSARRLPWRFLVLFALGCLLFVNGCSTEKNWDSQIGNYTYDEMVSDYGAPLTSTKVAGGGTVARWAIYREQEHTDELRQKQDGSVEHLPPSGSAWRTDYLYEMTFDSGGKLISWKKVRP
ncbi:MAG: hypothetical protein JWQ71_4784 [Pedosphaera sp.]|nr:hypothetical protein [Pedosphaera sp.]